MDVFILVPTKDCRKALVTRLEDHRAHWIPCLYEFQTKPTCAMLYGMTSDIRRNVKTEAKKIISTRIKDDGTPISIIALSKYWWAACLIAQACVEMNRKCNIVAFNPIVSINTDAYNKEDVTTTSLQSILYDHPEYPRRVVSALRPPTQSELCQVYMVFAEDSKQDADCAKKTRWIEKQSNCHAVYLPTAIHSLLFVFVPGVRVMNRAIMVNEHERRILSDSELSLIQRCRAEDIVLDKAIRNTSEFVSMLDFVSTEIRTETYHK